MASIIAGESSYVSYIPICATTTLVYSCNNIPVTTALLALLVLFVLYMRSWWRWWHSRSRVSQCSVVLHLFVALIGWCLNVSSPSVTSHVSPWCLVVSSDDVTISVSWKRVCRGRMSSYVDHSVCLRSRVRFAACLCTPSSRRHVPAPMSDDDGVISVSW